MAYITSLNTASNNISYNTTMNQYYQSQFMFVINPSKLILEVGNNDLVSVF